MMKPATLVFGLLFTAGAALSIAAGFLVIASLFIADRAPVSMGSRYLHVFIAGALVALGLILIGILMQVLGLARLVTASDFPGSDRFVQRVFRLVLLLGAGGTGLSGMLAIITWAILTRINEGFAVFG